MRHNSESFLHVFAAEKYQVHLDRTHGEDRITGLEHPLPYYSRVWKAHVSCKYGSGRSVRSSIEQHYGFQHHRALMHLHSHSLRAGRCRQPHT